MGVVVQLFGALGRSITDSRSILETSDRLRSAAARLQMDLQGVTVTMRPPRNPDDGEGYFEYIEGPVMQGTTGDIGGPPLPVNSDNGNTPDTTVGDFDDILMFTTRSTDKPFLGSAPSYVLNQSTGKYEFQTTITQSDVAEVAWFIRGRTLYRRQLLVAPGVWDNLIDPTTNTHVFPPSQGFYGTYIDPTGKPFEHNYDISIRSIKDASNNWIAIPNTLSDLTRRECRFAHPTIAFPFDARYWGQLGLPTLRECSDPGWYAEVWDSSVMQIMFPSALLTVDFWSNNPNARFSDSAIEKDASHNTYQGNRVADDVILTNVIGFDVKAWDPGVPVKQDSTGKIVLPSDPTYATATIVVGYGAYVDLGYEYRPSPSNDLKHFPAEISPDDNPMKSDELFYHRGHTASKLFGDLNNDASKIYYDNSRVYDTWSTHYEKVGLLGISTSSYLPAGRSSNGFDDPILDINGNVVQNPNGIVDDEVEKLTSPPYPVPLRGIQVKIRVFEPDSRQVRELTIVQEFLPK